MYHGIAELVVEDRSLTLVFFAPTRRRWQTVAKLFAYRVRNLGRGKRVVTRIVDTERAQYLLTSYTEWALRRQIDGA